MTRSKWIREKTKKRSALNKSGGFIRVWHIKCSMFFRKCSDFKFNWNVNLEKEICLSQCKSCKGGRDLLLHPRSWCLISSNRCVRTPSATLLPEIFTLSHKGVYFTANVAKNKGWTKKKPGGLKKNRTKRSVKRSFSLYMLFTPSLFAPTALRGRVIHLERSVNCRYLL